MTAYVVIGAVSAALWLAADLLTLRRIRRERRLLELERHELAVRQLDGLGRDLQRRARQS